MLCVEACKLNCHSFGRSYDHDFGRPFLNRKGSWARFCKDVCMKVVLVSNRCQQDGSFLETLWMLACALCVAKRVLEQVLIWPVSII